MSQESPLTFWGKVSDKRIDLLVAKGGWDGIS